MVFGRNEGFNPEAEPNTNRYEFSGGELFITDEQQIIQNFHDADRSTKLTLLSTEHEGPITSTELLLTKTGPLSDPRWRYTGKIVVQDATALATSNYGGYFKLLRERAAASGNAELEDAYYSNTRLLVAKASGALAIVKVTGDQRGIFYSNAYEGASKIHSEVSYRLTAPQLEKDLKLRPGGQLRAHIQQYLLALNALGELLEDQPKITRIAITPKQTYYLDKKKRFSSGTHHESAPGEHPVPAASPATENDVTKTVPEAPAVRTPMLEDIGGHEAIKSDLKRVVVSFKNPAAMERWGAERPQGIYLYGPAGTGKTMFAKALANEIGGELWEIKASEIYDKWIGNSEKNLQEIFAKARDIDQPTVMLWDEFDGLINSGNGNANSHTQERVAAIFKTETEKLRQNLNVIMVAITNNPDSVSDALIRDGRFDIKHAVPLPTEDARVQILINNVAAMTTQLANESFTPFADDLDFTALSRATDEMSGAAIENIFKQAAFNKAMQDAVGQHAEPISQADLLRVITSMRRG